MKIDLALRIRVDALQQRFASLDGLVEISPGVRSALVEYDPSKLPLASLLEVPHQWCRSFLRAQLPNPPGAVRRGVNY